jgi:uncharacterized protein YjbI with pentapeptide repeats
MQGLLSQFTYANVMSTLAVVLVLGGGVAYAADTVFSSDIVDDEVFSADVRDDTLAGGGLGAIDLRTDSVRTEEITNNQVRSIDVRNEGLSDGGLDAVDLNPDSVGTSEVDGSLTGTDVTDSSLLGADIEDGSLAGVDVATGSLLGADVGDGSLTGTDVEDGSLTGADVATGSLAGADVADNSLAGADINETTLAKVPDADKLDGLDSARFKNTANTGTGQCNNLGGATTCSSTTISGLVSGDDVYISAWWRWYGTAAGRDEASCSIMRGAVALEGARFGQNGNEHNLNDSSAMGSLVMLDATAPATSATYSLVCDENNGAMNIIMSRIVAFRLSG